MENAFTFVTVTSEDLSLAKQIGTQRNNANGGNDTPAYAHNGRLPYSSLTASRLAVVGEFGGHYLFGVPLKNTVFFVDRNKANYKALKANADFMVNGRKVEIRNSASPGSPVPVKKKDRDANAIVIQVHVEMKDGKPTGRVYFLGWRYGTDYRDDKAKRGTHYFPYKYPMDDLKAVLGL